MSSNAAHPEPDSCLPTLAFRKASSNLPLLFQAHPTHETPRPCPHRPQSRTNWKTLMPMCLSRNTSVILHICLWQTANPSKFQASGPRLQKLQIHETLVLTAVTFQRSLHAHGYPELTSVTREHPEVQNGLPSKVASFLILWGCHHYMSTDGNVPALRLECTTHSTEPGCQGAQVSAFASTCSWTYRHPVNLSMDSSLTSLLKRCVAISRHDFEQS